jgi:hypothetical protein
MKETGVGNFLVLSVGSQDVRGVLVRAANEGWDVLHTEDCVIVQEFTTFEDYMRNTARSIKTVLRAVSSRPQTGPQKIYLYLTSPWFGTEFRTITESRTTPFTVTNTTVADMFDRDVARFSASTKEKDFRVFDRMTQSMEYNGYRTSSIPKEAITSLTINCVYSYAPEILLKTIEQLVTEVYPEKPLVIRAGALALGYELARRSTPDTESSLITVGSTISDITLYRGTDSVAHVTIPLGTNQLLSRVAEILGKEHVSTKSFITMAYRGTLTGVLQDKILSAIQETQTQWIEAIAKGYKTLIGQRHAVSGAIYLQSEADVSMLYEDALKEITHLVPESIFGTIIGLSTGTLGKKLALQTGLTPESVLLIEHSYLYFSHHA